MNYRIIIQGNAKKMLLKIEKEEDNVWKSFEKIHDEDLIKEVLNDIIPEIRDYETYEENVYINLPNNGNIIIYNDHNVLENPSLESLNNRFNKIKKDKQTKKYLKGLCIGVVVTIGACQILKGYKDKMDDPKIIEAEHDLDITLLPNDLLNIAKAPSIYPKQMKEELSYLIKKNLPISIVIEDFIPKFGKKANDEKITFVKENYGEITSKYAKISGIDQEIIECLLAQERAVHSDKIDRGGAIGIAQIQYDAHIGSTKELRNEITGEVETFEVTDELLKDIDGNIKTGVAILQDNLDRYSGNIFMALQAYNYGVGAMRKNLNKTAERLNTTIDALINDPTDLSWLEEIHNYKDGNYGDHNYLNHVLSRYGKEAITAIYNDDENDVKLIIIPQEDKEKSQTY